MPEKTWMMTQTKSHRHRPVLITVIMLSACATTDPEHQVRVYYEPMVAQALAAQQHRPLSQPTQVVDTRSLTITRSGGRLRGTIR